LKSELPEYLAKCEDLDESYDVLQWWTSYELILPNWATTAKSILTVQPSSAVVERVFSLVNSGFRNSHYKTISKLQQWLDPNK